MADDKSKEGKFDGNLIGGTVRDMFEKHNRSLQGGIFPGAKNLSVKARQELEYAFTMILTEVANSDQNFEQREYTIIADALKALFGTSQSEAYTYINQARGSLQNMRGASSHAEILRTKLGPTQLRHVMQSIENLAQKDSNPTGFELFLRDKYSKLFGLS